MVLNGRLSRSGIGFGFGSCFGYGNPADEAVLPWFGSKGKNRRKRMSTPIQLAKNMWGLPDVRLNCITYITDSQPYCARSAPPSYASPSMLLAKSARIEKTSVWRVFFKKLTKVPNTMTPSSILALPAGLRTFSPSQALRRRR